MSDLIFRLMSDQNGNPEIDVLEGDTTPQGFVMSDVIFPSAMHPSTREQYSDSEEEALDRGEADAAFKVSRLTRELREAVRWAAAVQEFREIRDRERGKWL